MGRGVLPHVHHLPAGAIGVDLAHQAGGIGVAGAAADEVADDRMAGQVQVTHRIQGLVAHELIVVAQAFLVQDAVAVDDDGVGEAAAAG